MRELSAEQKLAAMSARDALASEFVQAQLAKLRIEAVEAAVQAKDYATASERLAEARAIDRLRGRLLSLSKLDPSS